MDSSNNPQRSFVFQSERSQAHRGTLNTAESSFNRLVSFDSSVGGQRVVPVDASKWSTDRNQLAPELFREFAEITAEYSLGELLNPENRFVWKHWFFGIEIGEHRQEGPFS